MLTGILKSRILNKKLEFFIKEPDLHLPGVKMGVKGGGKRRK